MQGVELSVIPQSQMWSGVEWSVGDTNISFTATFEKPWS